MATTESFIVSEQCNEDSCKWCDGITLFAGTEYVQCEHGCHTFQRHAEAYNSDD